MTSLPENFYTLQKLSEKKIAGCKLCVLCPDNQHSVRFSAGKDLGTRLTKDMKDLKGSFCNTDERNKGELKDATRWKDLSCP